MVYRPREIAVRRKMYVVYCGVIRALARRNLRYGEMFRRLLEAFPHPEGGPRVYAVDISSWPRCDARTILERSHLYHAFRHSDEKPVAAV
jgi:hypothetical protein